MGLKIEALQTADEYIERLQRGIEQVIEYYRDSKINEGSTLMIEIIDGLRWVVEVIELTQDIQVDKIDITDIKEVLKNIIDALDNQDNVFIADLFEYEVQGILQQYHQGIKATLQHNTMLN